jgi:predicted dithiol-disulfide oxidoreductase (DUF899 family)
MAQILNSTGTENHPVVSPAEWVASRKELLKKEKEFTRMRDELNRKRHELPWERVEKNYVFIGPNGQRTLADLFDGRSQLIVQHFMFGPDWKEGCPSCSFMADHLGGILPHLANRDVAFAAVSRATVPQIEEFKKRMGWRFTWVSSNQNDFNWDYHVSMSKEDIARGEVYYNYKARKYPEDWSGEEAPGISAFYKDAGGAIFHTYSTFERGVELVMATYQLLDIAPKGRDEDGLSFPMAWVRHHDRYPNQPAEATATGQAPKTAAGSSCHDEQAS